MSFQVSVDKFDATLQDLNKNISMLASRCETESKLSANVLNGAAENRSYGPPKGAEERSWMVLVPPLNIPPIPTETTAESEVDTARTNPDTARSSTGKRKSQEGVDAEEVASFLCAFGMQFLEMTICSRAARRDARGSR